MRSFIYKTVFSYHLIFINNWIQCVIASAYGIAKSICVANLFTLKTVPLGARALWACVQLDTLWACVQLDTLWACVQLDTLWACVQLDTLLGINIY